MQLHQTDHSEGGMHIKYRALIPLTFVVANIFMLTLCCWEQFSYMNGLAWDPGTYAAMVQHGLHNMINHTLSPYYIQRILPSAIVSVVLKILHLETSGDNIIRCFTVMNWVCINLAAFVLCRILRLLRQDYKTIFIGTFLFFFNICLMKCALYITVTPDILNMLLATMMFYFYLKKNAAILIILTVLACFVHPLMLIFGGILVCFPYHNEQAAGKSRLRPLTKMDYAIVIAAALSCLAFHLLFYKSINEPALYDESPTSTLMSVYPLALAGIICYTSVIVAFVLKTDIIRAAWSSVRWKNVALFLLVAIACKVAQHHMANTEVAELSMYKFGKNLIKQSIALPLGFFISHVNFFGLTILLIALNFKKFMSNNAWLGAGTLLCIFLCALMSIGSESRQFGFIFPIMVVSISMVLGREHMPDSYLVILIIAGIVLTRFWYKINLAPFAGKPRVYPDQRMFINYGPWMNVNSYLILLATTGAALLLLLSYHFYHRRIPDNLNA